MNRLMDRTQAVAVRDSFLLQRRADGGELCVGQVLYGHKFVARGANGADQFIPLLLEWPPDCDSVNSESGTPSGVL
jgi:hypothetical protein